MHESPSGEDSISRKDDSLLDMPASAVSTSQVSQWRRGLVRIRRRRVELVTDAQRSPTANRHHREKVYAWMQAIRIPFLLLSGWSYVVIHNLWLSAFFFLVSIPISWISVVIANGSGEKRDPRRQNVYKPALAREQAQALRSHSHSSLPSGNADSSADS